MKANIKRHIKEKSGFTLIEIMIVLAILGVLAAVATGIYKSYINKAKCTEVEVAVHDTMLSLMRELADSGTAPPSQSYASSHTLPSNESLVYPTNVQVQFSGTGTQATPFVVQGKRSDPVCNKGDGEYTLTQGETKGTW